METNGWNSGLHSKLNFRHQNDQHNWYSGVLIN